MLHNETPTFLPLIYEYYEYVTEKYSKYEKNSIMPGFQYATIIKNFFEPKNLDKFLINIRSILYNNVGSKYVYQMTRVNHYLNNVIINRKE